MTADVRQSKASSSRSTCPQAGESRELREIVKQIARMQEDELAAVKDKAAEYNRMIGPYPLMVVVVVLGCFGFIF